MRLQIKIISLFPATLDTREGATRLAEIIKADLAEDNKVELDFQGVIFMSRSFADQFHKDLLSGDHAVDLEIKNAETGIIEMLEAVSKTQNSRKPINKSYKVLSFNNLDKLRDYSFIW